MRRRGGQVGVVLVACLLAGAVAFPLQASAQSDFTWSGATTSPNWSDPSNWAGASVPSGSVGTVSFPDLTSAACTANPTTDACYQSYNDISGLGVNAISLDDGVQFPPSGYSINGDAITLGAGGITAAPSATNSSTGSSWGIPITLAASQTWSIAGGSSSGGGPGFLSLDAPVAGPSYALAIQMGYQGELNLQSGVDVEAGPISATSTSVNFAAGSVGLFGASLNYGDGNAVSVTGSAGSPLDLVMSSGRTGPLTVSEGDLQIGFTCCPASPGTLSVNGSVTLDSTSTFVPVVVQAGTTAGTDFSQMTATGTVNLGGSGLNLAGAAPSGSTCPLLNPGDVDTLVTTTGSLVGTFASIPDGTTVAINCQGLPGTPATVRINYTTNSVTATVLTSGSSSGAALSVTTAALPPATVGRPYSATLTAAGGTTPYTWSVTSGTLPPGLSLDASTGVISGTPATAGTSSFTVTVTDSATPTPATASANLSITVEAPLTLTTTRLPGAHIGKPYSATVTATGGTAPYTYTATGTLPPGMNLDPSTGVISGTDSTQTGDFSFTVTVTDAASNTASVNLSISVHGHVKT